MKVYSVLFLIGLFTVPLSAQEQESKPREKIFESNQSVTINGKRIDLKAEAGTFQVTDNQDKAMALFGFTYYEKKGTADVSGRPIMFAYNGGPGSSSFWLHMGILGPKRIPINDPTYTDPAPYQLVNNEFSVLDKADLVMIDPIGTGLSRPMGEKEFKDFWGVDPDIESISAFIRQFLIRKGRMNSPKFLLGESYGTYRNAGVMAELQDQGIALNGVIMVSAVFDLRQLVFPPYEDLSYIVHFPTYAATAWYHDMVPDKPATLSEFIDDVRTFTKNEYAPALFAGDQLSADEKEAMAQNLANYTGLSKQYWSLADLRVTNGEYFAEAMRTSGKTVGRLDSRFTGLSSDLISQSGEYDPQSAAISPPYITGFLNYLYNDLRVDRTMHYQTSAGGRKGFNWNWSHSGNNGWGSMQVAVTTLHDMERTMKRNPNMKVLIMNGLYDLATVFYGVEYSIDHMSLPPEIKDNITMTYYEAGHMMYIHEPSMKQFKADLDEFIDAHR